MYYGNIKKTDIANGEGVRVSLFVSGCRNHCKGCFNQQTWDFCYGKLFTKETEDEIIQALAPKYISGLTILGGEPFEEENQEVLAQFLKKVKVIYPHKNIWCYTGYIWDKDLVPENGAICHNIDIMLKNKSIHYYFDNDEIDSIGYSFENLMADLGYCLTLETIEFDKTGY